MGLMTLAVHGAAALLASVSLLDGVPVPAPDSAHPAAIRIAANTPVIVEIAAPLSSKTSKIGERFPILLAQPLMDGDRVIIPAGTSGMGEVVHSAKAGWLGNAGELLLAARYLEFNGVRLPLRRFELGGSGTDRLRETMHGQMYGVLTHGGDLEYDAGTRAKAMIAAAIELPGTREAGTAGGNGE